VVVSAGGASAQEPFPPPAVTPPEVVSKVDASYPETARVAGQQAEVTVLVTVGADGTVTEASVAEGTGPPFDDAALAAVRQWRFKPARRGRDAIQSRIRIPFRFALPSAAAPAPRVVPPPSPQPLPVRADPLPPGGEREAEGDVVDVTVHGHRTLPPRASSDFVLDREVLVAAPHQNAGDLLLRAPGVYVSQFEGEAVAHEIFLRGFDAEHGQDMELTVGGMVPINQPSHIHGQGYADLGFIIPETVRSLRVTEGVYDPRQGDFAVAGSVDFDLAVAERGTKLKSSWGSFGTYRAMALFAPHDDPDETFGAASFRKSQGYGMNRGSQSASAMGQLVFFWPHGWRGSLLAAAYGARANLAGVVRRDDVEAGRVGFYDSYPDPNATAQSALAGRAQLSLGLERLADDGSRTSATAFLLLNEFRLRENFTGSLQRSREMPEWVGRGDLIEEFNQAMTVGARFSHQRAPWSPWSWLRGVLEVGLAFRGDFIEQAQNLIKAPQNETWDHRVDATIRGLDIGSYIDGDLRLGSRVQLRGGFRADALVYDIDDRLGNFIPLFQRQSHFPGFRRTALGFASGPRATLEVRATRWLSALASYGEGYRSPQARQLEEGERAPYTKVRSMEVGVRGRLGSRDQLTFTGAAFNTALSEDLAFDPQEGSLARIGPTTRRGLAGQVTARPGRYFLASLSATGVRATLDAPPPPTTANPTPAYRAGALLPYVPPLVMRADLAVTPELRFGDWAPLHARAGLGFTHLSSRPLPYGQSGDPTTLVDVSAGIRWRFVEAGLEASNLFDTRYAAGEFSFVSNWGRPDIPSLVPARHISAGPPRTILLTVTVSL
jgi:TonB family protein